MVGKGRQALRTGILGCGDFANRHAKIITTLSDQCSGLCPLDLVAFCDRNEVRAQSFAAQYGDSNARVYTDHHEMFKAAGLDIVTICLPPYGHSDEVQVAAELGIHVLIEKPIAMNSEHAWSMVRAAEAHGIKTQVGFMYRFGAAIDRLKQMIETGEAGPVGLMSACYFCNSLHSEWWRVRDKSGGQLFEQVVHMIDLMRFLMGEASSVYSLQNNLFHRHMPDYTIEDISGTVIGFRNGGIGVIYASNAAIPGKWINDYRLITGKITVEFSDANHARLSYSSTPDKESELIASDKDYYRLEWLDFLEAIEKDGHTRTPLREGALTLELAQAAMRSADTGSVIHL
jgi:predicted dehydrogenase